MLSLIIPAKELDGYLFDTINNYTLTFDYEYEIIIVYDVADEAMYDKFVSKFNNDKRISLLMSPIEGRINALNYGYTNSKGDIIKCIDADDNLLVEYFEILEITENYSAHCHNADLININNESIGTYIFDSSILFNEYKYVLVNLKSPPRWVWSFKREIADLIFPIPPDLFAEDIWFSLIIKRNCTRIYHLNSCVYQYKQHEGGEWGGIRNFSSEVMRRRAQWSLTLIPVLLENKSQLGIMSDDIFYNIINYNKVLLGNKSLSNINFSETTKYYKLKLLIIMYFPAIASIFLSFKWFVSKRLLAFSNV